jgi:hypothetical protein
LLSSHREPSQNRRVKQSNPLEKQIISQTSHSFANREETEKTEGKTKEKESSPVYLDSTLAAVEKKL